MKREFLVQNPRPDGYHLMMELYGCDSGKINSRRYLHNLVKCAVKKSRAYQSRVPVPSIPAPWGHGFHPSGPITHFLPYLAGIRLPDSGHFHLRG